MATDTQKLYSLVADLLSLVSRYDLGSVRAAMEHVRKNELPEGVYLVDALQVLEHVMQTRESAEPHDEPRPDKNGSVDPMERELRAILSDKSFVPTRDALRGLLRSVFGRDVPSFGPKDSRQRIVQVALDAFTHATDSRRRQMYRNARRAYLTARQSTLGEWSKIIASERG